MAISHSHMIFNFISYVNNLNVLLYVLIVCHSEHVKNSSNTIRNEMSCFKTISKQLSLTLYYTFSGENRY